MAPVRFILGVEHDAFKFVFILGLALERGVVGSVSKFRVSLVY